MIAGESSERLLREGLCLDEYIGKLFYTSLVMDRLVSIAHLDLYCMKACRVGTGSKLGGLGSRSSFHCPAWLVWPMWLAFSLYKRIDLSMWIDLDGTSLNGSF